MRHDYKCPDCGHVQKDVWTSTMREELGGREPVYCKQCAAEMERLPSAPNFVVKGFNAKNGYSK